MKNEPLASPTGANETRSGSALVLDRQEPLRRRYVDAPEEAWITERALSAWDPDDDPFHGRVDPGRIYGAEWAFGITRAVGGYHDRPNPGDMLCASLASCYDSTLRIVAARMGLPIKRLAVEVVGNVDVRGTLAVTPDVQVGFQHMRCTIDLELPEGAPEGAADQLTAAVERASVILQTLRNGVQVDVELEGRGARHAGAARENVSESVSSYRPPYLQDASSGPEKGA
jgi:uncharacterized OsmC-like protein